MVDTVGAGDSFLAGLLAYLLRAQAQQASLAPTGMADFIAALPAASYQQALRHALASASLCVQERGCVPPSWQAAQDWAAAHPARQG